MDGIQPVAQFGSALEGDVKNPMSLLTHNCKWLLTVCWGNLTNKLDADNDGV